MCFFTLILFVAFINQGPQDVTSRLENHVRTYSERGVFQGTVLVARKGEVLYQGAFGFANKESGIKNTIETQFLIGSTTKSFTAVTVMQFVEDGLIDLHEPILSYLPYLNTDIADGMTMHYLLKQQSGLLSHMNRITQSDHRDIDHREMVELIGRGKMRFTPGEKYAYSNLAYNLAASVLCEVAGKSYREIMNERVFKPLDMQNTGVERTSHLPKNKAIGYDIESDGTLRPAEAHDMAYAMGSGDIYSNVSDLFKWDQALYENTYVSKESKKIIFDPADEEHGFYGYGFRIIDYKRADGSTGTLARHGGSMRGYLANVHRYIDGRITVIVLGNMRPFPIRDLCFELKEIVLGRDPGPRDHE